MSTIDPDRQLFSALNRLRRTMMEVSYYREQAARARRLAKLLVNPEVERQLLEMAQGYDDIVVDLEAGAIEVRHPELMPMIEPLMAS